MSIDSKRRMSHNQIDKFRQNQPMFNEVLLFDIAAGIVGLALVYWAYKILSKLISLFILLAIIALMVWAQNNPDLIHVMFS
jgi:hypothetical protein